MKAVIVLLVSEVREVFAKVLSDFKIPYTRVPVEAGLQSCSWLMPHLRNFYTQVEKDALDSIPVFTRYGIRSVSVFCFGFCVCLILFIDFYFHFFTKDIHKNLTSVGKLAQLLGAILPPLNWNNLLDVIYRIHQSVTPVLPRLNTELYQLSNCLSNFSGVSSACFKSPCTVLRLLPRNFKQSYEGHKGSNRLRMYCPTEQSCSLTFYAKTLSLRSAVLCRNPKGAEIF